MAAAVVKFNALADPVGTSTQDHDAGLIARLPWGIVLLFGGGFALAKGFQDTGLSTIIGAEFSAFSGLPTFWMIVILCLVITFMTELTSNTATTEMILPILAAVAVPRYIDLESNARQRAIDAGISELNGRESLTWADQKISITGYSNDTNLHGAVNYTLGGDYSWSGGGRPATVVESPKLINSSKKKGEAEWLSGRSSSCP